MHENANRVLSFNPVLVLNEIELHMIQTRRVLVQRVARGKVSNLQSPVLSCMIRGFRSSL